MPDDRRITQMKLRLPEPLKEWLAQAAEANRRSANAEILVRLEMSRKIEEAAIGAH